MYPCRKGGGNGNVYVTFYCGFYSANVYAVSANGQKMVPITPPFSTRVHRAYG
jgi:hypothetical protein